MSRSPVLVLLLLHVGHAWAADVQKAFGFQEAVDFSRVGYHANSSVVDDTEGTVKPKSDTSEADAEGAPPSAFDDRVIVAILVACFFLAIAIAVICAVRVTKANKSAHLSVTGVDSTKANDTTTYHKSFDPPRGGRLCRGGVAFATDLRKPAPNHSASGVITIRTGTILDRDAPLVQQKLPTTRASHTPNIATKLPKPTSLATEPRPSGDSVLRGYEVGDPSRSMTHVSASTLLMRVESLLAHHQQLPSPTTPPPPVFSPHSPTHSPRTRESTFSVEDRDHSEVAM